MKSNSVIAIVVISVFTATFLATYSHKSVNPSVEYYCSGASEKNIDKWNLKDCVESNGSRDEVCLLSSGCRPSDIKIAEVSAWKDSFANAIVFTFLAVGIVYITERYWSRYI